MLQLPPQKRTTVATDADHASAPFRVLIVKWDRLGADALRHAVAQTCGHAQTQVCHTASEALAHLRANPVFLGLFGLTLPDMDGLDLLTVVTDENLVERRMVVSGRHDERARQMLRHARIHGYFDSSIGDSATLGVAIRQVAEGRVYYSPTSEGVPGGERAGACSLQQLLSATELLVFALIGDGSDDAEAGEHLGLCANTVRCHRQRIMRKLGVQSRAELMRQAIGRGVVRFLPNRIQRPGFERELAERQSRSRNQENR